MRFSGVFLIFFLLIEDVFAATCPSGFDDVTNIYPATFYSKNGDFCPSGYEPYTAPATLSFKFNGLILDNAPTICGSDSHYVDGECVPYAQENCNSGFYKNTENSATFYSKNGNLCPTGYEPYTYGINVSFVFNGLILSTVPTVCASGHYVDGVCSPYDSSGCITGYVDAGVDGIMTAVDANGACPSGYNALWAYQSCTPTTTDRVCTTLCNGGLLQTGNGYCVATCDIGISSFHVGTNVTYPVYGTRTTTPSMVVSDGTNVCYVNATPGNSNGSLKFLYNNTVYHLTD